MDKDKKFEIIFWVVVVIFAILAVDVINCSRLDRQNQGKDFDVYLTTSGVCIFSLDTNNNNPVSIELYSNSRFELTKYRTDENSIQSDRILNMWTIKTNIEPSIKWIVEGTTKIQAIIRSQENIKLVFLDNTTLILIIVNVLAFILIITVFITWFIMRKIRIKKNNS